MTTNELVLTARQATRLRDHLLREDALERVAFAACSPSADRLLVEDLTMVADDDVVEQSPTACRPTLALEREFIHECHVRGQLPLVIHSHPFDSVPRFSHRDTDLMDRLQAFVTGLYSDADTSIGFGVLGTEGLTATIYDRHEAQFIDCPTTVLGNRRLDPPLTTALDSERSNPSVEIDYARYDRGIRALGTQGQQQLAAIHIALIGCGGLGSIMAEELARFGVQQLTLVDPDVIEKSNLPRLFGAYDHHLDRPKVDVLKEHLHRCQPGIDVTTVQARAEDAAADLKQCDLLVGGVDEISARIWLTQFAARHLIPYVDSGVLITTTDTGDPMPATIATMEGYIQRFVPGATACFDCLDRGDLTQARIERLSPEEREEELERGYIDESDLSPEPAVVPLNGITASKTVQLVAKHVTGYATPADYLRFEGIDNTLTELSTEPSPNCPTCAPTGICGRGDRTPTPDDIEAAHPTDDTGHTLDLDTDLIDASPASTDTTGPLSAATATAFEYLAVLLDNR